MAIRDIMNNYFYGKQGRADMTVADLPATRLELFFTVLKVRWSNLIGVNLLYLLIWIPGILWTLLNVTIISGMAGAEDVAYALSDYRSVAFTWLAGMIPCIAITGPANAGATYILRNWARDEHSFVLSDFTEQLRGNWRQALPVSAISGLLPFLAFVCVGFYADQLSTSPVFLLPIAVILLGTLMWSMMTLCIYTMMVTYTLTLRDILRNALLMTVGRLPHAALIKLITLMPLLLGLGLALLIPNGISYIVLVLALMYLLFIPAFNKLIAASYANWLCESFLNPKIEGARTDIGLRPRDWDDTEYRPEDDEV